MSDTAIILTIVLGLCAIIYRFKNFKTRDFTAGLKMTLFVFAIIGLFIIYKNGGLSIGLAEQSVKVIDEGLGFSETVGMFIYNKGVTKTINISLPIYRQPVGFIVLLYFALCTLSFIFANYHRLDFRDILWGYLNIPIAFVTLIIYIVQLVYFETFHENSQTIYAIFVISVVCIGLAGLYSFFSIFSTVVAITKIFSILFIGSLSQYTLANIWDIIFNLMSVEDNIAKIIILFLVSISSSWDTLIKQAFEDTKVYNIVTDFFAYKLVE